MREAGGRGTWKPLLSDHGSGRKRGIYSTRELRELIVYERARADRTGDKLSVVLCGMNGQSGSRKFVNRAIHSLSCSIRNTDHLGWYGKRCLAVVLPLTGFEGARKFTESLAAAPANGGQNVAGHLEFSIHAYPDKWFDSQTDAGARPGGRDATLYFTRPVPRWKRALDIFGSLAGLIALSPLFALLAGYVRVVSPGPVIFRQKRVGLARKEFTFYKFRTMHHRNEEEVHSHHAKDFIYFDKPMTKLDGIDPRIIKGGRILRKLAIDELPQLFNILKGDMSLVGPRPCIPYEADEYLQWHTDRFSILPGLTGLWQVSGKNKLTFQQMIRLDIEYSRKMSLLFDLWIILRTIPTVIGLGIEGTSRRLQVRKERKEEERQERVESDAYAESASEPHHAAAK